MKSRYQYQSFAGAILVAAVAWCSAAAQHRADPVSADTLHLNEITITAIKQGNAEATRTLGSTIITAEQAEQAHAISPKTAAPMVPNLFIPDYGSRITSSIYVRGIGSRIDQPAMGITVDNLPLMSKEHYDADLADIERIEVIRGPQGLLFGRNTMGGVMNIYTLSPLAFQGLRAEYTVGSYNSHRFGAGIYIRPTHTVGLSATVRHVRTDGQWRNDYTGRLVDFDRSWQLRLRADCRPTDNLLVSNVFALGTTRQGGYPYEYTLTRQISHNDTCCYRRTSLTNGLTVTWQLPDITLAGITGYQLLDDRMTLDQDFLPLPYFTLDQSRREHAFTQDLLVRSNSNRAYQWLVGMFAFYKRLHMNAPVTFKDTGIAELIESHRNDALPSYPITWDTRQFLLNSRFFYPTWGLAAYHRSSISIGNVLLTAGVRVGYEHATLQYHCSTHTGYTVLDGATGTVYAHQPIDIDNTNRLYKHHFDVLPQFSATWNRRGSTLSRLEFRLSRGSKAGGFNTQMFSDVLQQQLMGMMGIGAHYNVSRIVAYKPETAWTTELGGHIQHAPAGLQADFNVFFTRVRNQQLTVFPDGTTTGRVMTNAGRTHIWGIEASVSAQPVDNLSLNVNYGMTHATFSAYNDGRGDYRGKYVPYVPQHTLYANIAYRLPVNRRGLQWIQACVDLRAAGNIRWNEANTLQQPFYALLGAYLTAQLPAGLQLQLWGTNLTNTRYHTFYFLSIGHEFVQRGQGRRFGATIRLSI